MSTWNKTKGCTPWAREWLTSTCVGTSASKDDVDVRVDALNSLDGDVELGNRKGKLITIFDTSVTFAWTGTKGEEKADGLLVCDEFSHEVHDEKRDYEFNVTQSGGPSAVKELVKTELVPQLIAQLAGFRNALIEKHAKDLGHDDATASGAATPTSTSSSAPAAAPPSSGATKSASTTASATTSTTKASASDVRVSLDLPMAQDDLWDLLTNPARIPMWTRSRAEFSTEPGSSFSLFNGNVTGTVVSAEAPKSLVQKWRVQQWPSGHLGVLKMSLSQSHDSSKLELVLSGAPVGEEETIEKGLRMYYLTSLQGLSGGVLG
ncbi:Co-chaperone [Tilletia horrida]|uniref:Co-chaperone n=1 Tax=Tilletia horrida TaxID=155126 RepID=A0AAN6GUJ4_9BASI|nr:Co-chaperone [Tilletia horrida]KAK0569862.1 Co-chaperone [Tilletia horrida]